MNILLRAFLLAFLFQACVDTKERNELPNLELASRSENSNPTQVFRILPGSDTTIVGKSGTRIYISANSFEFENGQEPTSVIEVSLKEIYSYSEMLLNGLTTTSNGQLLGTSGMINILATSEAKPLRLKKDFPIKIHFNKISSSRYMQTFLGEKDEERLNWQLDEENIYDTIKFSKRTEVIIEDDRPGDYLSTTTINFGIINRDTFEISRSTIEGTIDVRDGEGAVNSDDSPFYVLHSTKLGWINCDYFIFSPENLDVKVNKIDSTVLTFMIFRKSKSIMMSSSETHLSSEFQNIPKGSDVILLSILSDAEGYQMALSGRKLVAGDSVIDLKYKKVTIDEIEKQIRSIDKRL